MSTSKKSLECQWEDGTLGLSADHAVPAPASLDREVDDALALQMISIRLPRGLLDDLKLIAEKEGLGYQPLIRRVLMRFANAEFRSMVRSKLTSTLSELNAEQEHCEEVEEPQLKRA
ncbi:hypothetical protein RDV84_23195 [Lysobacter yananisis]|uniref:CopG family transcriptional regulator n=1 Tax=Lysobacter yananisis TaxID=1003114 RepID=A0ABY9P7C5_9GAMM|nr:hypothetical protein [Lysobacter yananisis]WMT02834.1 hypothetical protein RDV84_23195 [Lysobacter yananisis]